MKRSKLIYITVLVVAISMLGCEDFVDIDPPNFQITTSNIFKDDKTATAAVKGIYNQLYHNNTAFSNGWENSVTVLAGMSGGLISPRSVAHTKYGPFSQHDIFTLNNPASSANLSLWSSAYNIIYLANSVIEGLGQSDSLTEATQKSLLGQALFIRAFTYFYLVNLYGDVPLILTTDYQVNTTSSRIQANEVWEQIETDLDKAILLLKGETSYTDGERTKINLYAAMALQARVCLYRKNWSKAEALSSKVIEQTSTYEILEDPTQVFLANSREAIWQISPVKGSSIYPTNCNEASVFIIYPRFGVAFGNIKLDADFLSEFKRSDKRKVSWVGEFSNELHYPYKYKVRSIYNDVPEYSMVLRLAEQYLIRAEARTHLNENQLVDAISDIDKIRQRAGIPLISETNPNIGQEDLLDTIMLERKKELFSEWGHRWLDLKRTGKVLGVFGDDPLWENTDVFYPIPEEEQIKNPNLSPNDGY